MESYQEAKELDGSAVLVVSATSPVELTKMLTGSFKGFLQRRFKNGVEIS